MKRSLLLTVAIGITVFATAQKSPAFLKEGIKSASSSNAVYEDIELTKTPSTVNYFQPEGRGTAEVTVVNLGTSANAFGLYNGGRTALWADPNLNTVIFTHRLSASPGSGFIGYDVSKDGGNTWTVNNQVFDPNAGGTANARYPQGVIYNPQGNTIPDSAWFHAFFPTLDNSNPSPPTGTWGGYGTATEQLDGTDGSQDGWPTDPPIRQNVPDAMTINPVTGEVWVVEPSYIGGLATNYTDSLVISRGVFNEATNQFDYEQSLFYAPTVHGETIAGIADTRIAFAPDGQVGYIMLLADNQEDVFATGLAYYPVLFKTTDGGNTWDESPITVPLGGPEGMEGIVEDLLTDDQIAELFEPPLPARDEIVYTTAFTSDFAVDYNGNPVISVVIGVAAADPYSIVSAVGFFASYNIFGNDQGEGDWFAVKLGDNLKTFRGTWGDVDEDNRSQLTTTYDGTVMFFSWLDTDFEGVEDNIQPDIYCAAWDVVNNMYTEVINVTTLSEAWLQAFMGTASYYALTPEDGSYIVPFAYQEMDVTNTANPVQYKYIPDFTITDDMFTIVKANNITTTTSATVSQNYPNPFKGTTQISVVLTKQANVSVEVYNIVGQKVYEIPSASFTQGAHKLTIKSDMLKSGVYTYSVKIDGEKISRKMIVE
jgi:hypothetical protein